MVGTIYVKNGIAIENYTANINADKIKKVQAKIDDHYGKGELLEQTTFCLNPMNDFSLYGKKIEVVSKIYAGETTLISICCGEYDETTTSLYYYKYYAYEQGDLSLICDKILKARNAIDLSVAIKHLLTFSSKIEYENDLAEELKSCIEFKKISVNEQLHSLAFINTFLKKHRDKNEMFPRASFGEELKKRIAGQEAFNHGFLRGVDPNFTPKEKIAYRKRILDTLPTTSSIV